MIDNAINVIKKKLKYNGHLIFDERRTLYNCVEKLEKIEQTIERFKCQYDHTSSLEISSFDVLKEIEDILWQK